MSTGGGRPISVKCIHCREDVETDGRMSWWHSETGYVECELYAAPQFTYTDGSHH